MQRGLLRDDVADGRTLDRVLGEYREMPGLCLTLPQAARLWQIDARACESLLDALVEQGILKRTRDGAFVRRDA